jgi:putative ABC transport system permease protein
MTIAVDDRLQPVFQHSLPRPRTRAAGQWRFAARLARREVRRRPGRTLLVMLLVAIPVFGMTTITVLVRTNTDTKAKIWERQFGQADLVSATDLGAASGRAPALPAGSRSISGRYADTIGLSSENGTARLADVTDLPLADPITRGAVLLRSGHFPTALGDALISPGLASAFHVGIGDTLRLASPAWTEHIVGIGVRATDWNDGLLAVRGDELHGVTASSIVGANLTSYTMVKLPGHPSDAELRSFAPAYESVPTLPFFTDGARGVDWILVGGGVALAIIGIVIAGAFAVGARRQLVTLGQLSANGADERLLRRTLSLQGLWCGVLGSALGVLGGALWLVTFRGHLDTWIRHDPGPYVWAARDLVPILVTGMIAATIAAFIPARSAARVPVLSALAGRRPLGSLPARIVPIGLALFGGGVFVLVLVASASRSQNGGNNALALSAVLGGLLVLAGACCVTSVVVASLAHLARRVRGAGRIAVRSIVRSRARSAAVVMALAAVNSGAIAIATALDSHKVNTGRSIEFMPANALAASTVRVSANGRTYTSLDPTVAQTLHRILPHAHSTTMHAVVAPEGLADGPPGLIEPDGPDGPNVKQVPVDGGGPLSIGGKRVATAQPDTGAFVVDSLTVADPAVLHFVRLSSRDTRALDDTGALVLDGPDASSNATGTPTIDLRLGSSNDAPKITAALSRDSAHGAGGIGGGLITSAEAAKLHLSVVDAGTLVVNSKDFDESQRASLDVLDRTLSAQTGASDMLTNMEWTGPHGSGLTPAEFERIVILVVLVIALIVLAMSLALSAAETRDERDVLVSLGARPATMRSVAACKAALLAASGALIAIPTGFIPIAVVFIATTRGDERTQLSFPLSTTLLLLVVAPIVGALVAYLGSGIAQTVRPTKMSTFASD